MKPTTPPTDASPVTARTSDTPLAPRSIANMLRDDRMALPLIPSVPMVPMPPGAMVPRMLVKKGVLTVPLPDNRPVIRK